MPFLCRLFPYSNLATSNPFRPWFRLDFAKENWQNHVNPPWEPTLNYTSGASRFPRECSELSRDFSRADWFREKRRVEDEDRVERPATAMQTKLTWWVQVVTSLSIWDLAILHSQSARFKGVAYVWMVAKRGEKLRSLKNFLRTFENFLASEIAFHWHAECHADFVWTIINSCINAIINKLLH